MTKLPFGFERPEDSPGFLLWQTTILWQRMIKKALEPYNITHAQFVCMALLLWLQKHQLKTSQALLVEWSKLDKMTVSKSLKELGKKGLIFRNEGEKDTRTKIVSLTSSGKDLIYKLVPLVEKIDAEFFGKVSLNEQLELKEILKELTRSRSIKNYQILD